MQYYINHIIFTKYICSVSNKNVYTSYLIIINHFSSIEIYNIKLVLFVKVLQAWQQTHTNALINGGMCGVRWAYTVPTREIPGVCGDSRYKCRLYPCEPFSIKEGLYIGRSVLLRYFYQHTNFFPHQKLIDLALHLFTNLANTSTFMWNAVYISNLHQFSVIISSFGKII